jgi:hypothetical protein
MTITGGIFGNDAIGMIPGGGMFGRGAVSGLGRCGCGSVVPDDFGVDLENPSLPVTEEIQAEADRLAAENAEGAVASGSGVGDFLSTKTGMILAVGLAAVVGWMVFKPGRSATPNRRKMTPSRKRIHQRELAMATLSDDELLQIFSRRGPKRWDAQRELLRRDKLARSGRKGKTSRRRGPPRGFMLPLR